jgi:hypothetical protein
MHLVRLACELPEQAGRSLGQWDCAELARQLVIDEVVAAISPQTVQRLLAANRLKPWRSHVWLHPRTPRDAAFAAHVRAVADLLTRPLAAHELVLSLDEMTSLQPRPRRVATRPAQPGRPIQVEHEYQRAGATHLFAAFDTRSGRVYGVTTRRKRQIEYLTLLEQLDLAIPTSVTTIHLLADNVSVHHGKLVRQWLAAHPRFVAHFTPVHCSWMNPVEQRPHQCRSSTEWRQPAGVYHGVAPRPPARGPCRPGGSAVRSASRAPVGDRTARWQPSVRPRHLVYAACRVAGGAQRARERAG